MSQVTESGMLGVAVDPNFTQNRYIYLYYTHDGAALPIGMAADYPNLGMIK